MAQYIDKSALVAEIENIIADETESIKSFEHSKNVSEIQRSNARIGVLTHLCSLINTLEVKEVEEPVSEDSHIKKSQEFQHDPESCKENGNYLTCSGSEELEKAAVEAYKKIVEKGGVSFLKIFKAGAKWKENQLMKDAIECIVLFDYYGSDNLTYGCIEHDSFCLEDRGLKDKDKVKLIIIKED